MTIKSLICLTLLVASGTVAYSDTPDAGVRILVHQASQLPIPKSEQAGYTEWLEKVDKNLEGRRPVYEMEADEIARLIAWWPPCFTHEEELKAAETYRAMTSEKRLQLALSLILVIHRHEWWTSEMLYATDGVRLNAGGYFSEVGAIDLDDNNPSEVGKSTRHVIFLCLIPYLILDNVVMDKSLPMVVRLAGLRAVESFCEHNNDGACELKGVSRDVGDLINIEWKWEYNLNRQCAVAEESPWVENLGGTAGGNVETRGLLDFLETIAAQQVVFSLQQDAAKLTLTSAGMTVTADKNTVTGESGTVMHNMRLAFGLVQGSIVRKRGHAYFFPMKEEDKVTDDFFELVTNWVEAHVPSTSAPHVLIEFGSPDGGPIYVFFESADDGKSAKIRKIFYASPEDLEFS